MEALSVREYRNNLAASFTKADNGEQVLIRRKNEIYALVKVGREGGRNFSGERREGGRGDGRRFSGERREGRAPRRDDSTGRRRFGGDA